jgi:hypothetical protein
MDGGITWTEIFSYSLPGGYATVNAVLIHPIDTSIWLLSHDGEVGDTFRAYIWRSTDGGDSWDLTLVTTNTVESIVIDHWQPDVVYVADDGYWVLKSDDGGDSWTVVRSVSAGSTGNRLAIDPNVSGHVYLGGFGYIAETVDGGATWSDWNDPPNQSTPWMEPSVLVVDSGTVTQTLYAGFTGVWAYSRPALQPLRVYLPVVVRGYTP